MNPGNRGMFFLTKSKLENVNTQAFYIKNCYLLPSGFAFSQLRRFQGKVIKVVFQFFSRFQLFSLCFLIIRFPVF